MYPRAVAPILSLPPGRVLPQLSFLVEHSMSVAWGVHGAFKQSPHPDALRKETWIGDLDPMPAVHIPAV